MRGVIFSGMQSRTKYDEIPFVPCNDCSAYESCTQEAYEQGKAEGRTEAIDEFYNALAVELTWIVNSGAVFMATRREIYDMISLSVKEVQVKLKEQKDG